jgi:hypothetical protein
MLVLVVISATSYAGDWVQAFDENHPVCIKGKLDCYQGTNLDIIEFVTFTDVPLFLVLLPAIDLISSLLLSFLPNRAYASLFLIQFISILSQTGLESITRMYFKPGLGQNLHISATFFLVLLSIPLAITEQMRIRPDIDYEKVFRLLPGG